MLFDFDEHDVDAYGCCERELTDEVAESSVLTTMKDAIEHLL